MSVWGMGQGYQPQNFQSSGGGSYGSAGPSMWQTSDPRPWTLPGPAESIDTSGGTATFWSRPPTNPYGRAMQEAFGAPNSRLSPVVGGGSAFTTSPDQFMAMIGDPSKFTDDQMFALDKNYGKLKGAFAQANQYYVDALAAKDPTLGPNVYRDQANLRNAFRAYEERASRLGIL